MEHAASPPTGDADGAAVPARRSTTFECRAVSTTRRAPRCPTACARTRSTRSSRSPPTRSSPDRQRLGALPLEPPGLSHAADLDRERRQPRDHEPALPRRRDRSGAGDAADQARRRRGAGPAAARRDRGDPLAATASTGSATVAIPVGMMMILLFSVMSAAPQLLNSVIEEKMSRISEVLIGSVTPFQLMLGKLAGSVAVSVLLASIYIVGAHRRGAALRLRRRHPRRSTSAGCSSSCHGRVHVRLDLHHHRRRLFGSQGRAGHDDAGDVDHDAAVDDVVRRSSTRPTARSRSGLSLFPTRRRS